jgi:hypothetical protein
MPFDRGEFGAVSLTEDGLSSNRESMTDVFGNSGLLAPHHSSRHKGRSQGRSQPHVERCFDQSIDKLQRRLYAAETGLSIGASLRSKTR